MIDWMELFMYNRFDYDVQHFVGHGNDGYYKPRADNRHEKIERWIANRINRRLAGYEAMKNLVAECKSMYIVEDWRHLAALAYDMVGHNAEKDYKKERWLIHCCTDEEISKLGLKPKLIIDYGKPK
jgi:hypothetical protein